MDEPVRPRGAANRTVAAVLASPLHRLLSSRVCLVRYRGRRSDQPHATPTQYVRHDDSIVILVARPDDKTWWRNFTGTGHPLDLLLQRRWQPMVGRVVTGTAEPELARRLLDAYLARFPRVTRALEGTALDEKVRHLVVVWCHPVPPEATSMPR